MIRNEVMSTNEMRVSMKSGLEGRNNGPFVNFGPDVKLVSMKSGLEGRNNTERMYWDDPLLLSQ